MAGLAETCSHIGAVLHWVEAAVRMRNETSCTSKENKWMIPTPVKQIPPRRLGEIDFSAPNASNSRRLRLLHVLTIGLKLIHLQRLRYKSFSLRSPLKPRSRSSSPLKKTSAVILCHLVVIFREICSSCTILIT